MNINITEKLLDFKQKEFEQKLEELQQIAKEMRLLMPSKKPKELKDYINVKEGEEFYHIMICHNGVTTICLDDRATVDGFGNDIATGCSETGNMFQLEEESKLMSKFIQAVMQSYHVWKDVNTRHEIDYPMNIGPFTFNNEEALNEFESIIGDEISNSLTESFPVFEKLKD